MERQTYFADVILPQALPRILTYRVPVDMNENVGVGKRVVVPLGKTKLHTGVVKYVHTKAPSNYEARYIESVLDASPVVNAMQLEFWDWMAHYYCCTTGEVMNAALPAGLKLSSETKFVLAPFDDTRELNEREQVIINALRIRGKMTTDEIADTLAIRHVQPIIKSMVESGLLQSEEEISEKFKPRTKEFIRLGAEADTDEKLNQVFAELEKRNAQRQSDALLLFLRLANYDGNAGAAQKVELEKSKLTSGEITHAHIQALVEKGVFTLEIRETGRLEAHLLASEKPKSLSSAQNISLQEIHNAWKEKDVTLLHGVTSSGKTEIYASLIESALQRGEQVLFLLPEIALTTQIIHRLRKFFGKRVGIYHSGYSDNERTEVWKKVLSDQPGECDVILGARSALFLPFTRLGLIIVDEEHEHSFKQHDPAPRYQARDAALVLAKKFNAKVLLGSATPSMETYYSAKTGRFGLSTLSERYGGMELPEIELCDIRKDLKAKTMTGNFTSPLLEAMNQAIEAGEQVILFQNRRGYSPLWECQSCGWVPMCTRCDVSLTYHKQAHLLKCHYCGYSCPPVEACHACGSMDVKMLGFGTEKIDDDLQEIMPSVRVQRMDLDTTRTRTGYQKIISDFESGHIQILVGTQMVTKGLDFDHVSLVGILNADKMMNFPDFRSMERSFQIMMQVAGRAGRKHKRGRVLIQTYNPDHWLLEMVKRGDYLAFYEKEIHERYQFAYPPFTRLMRITLRHKDEHTVLRAAEFAATVLKPIMNDHILGPEKPYIPRINNYYLQQFLVRFDRKSGSADMKQHMVDRLKQALNTAEFKSVRIHLDVDPV